MIVEAFPQPVDLRGGSVGGRGFSHLDQAQPYVFQGRNPAPGFGDAAHRGPYLVMFTQNHAYRFLMNQTVDLRKRIKLDAKSVALLDEGTRCDRGF